MLIDTNIVIEIAKRQKHYQECVDLLNAISQKCLGETAYITKFTLNAIEALLSRFDSRFLKKILIMIYQGTIQICDLDIQDDLMILSSLNELGLDFDDATQFLAANKLKTYIVTLDKDFKKTGIEIKTPAQALKNF